MPFDVVGFTAEYEEWLGARIPLVEPDLHAKHREMADSVLRFLRGTYHLWLRRVADLLPELLDGPAVPLVGDLHVENFGTWRDRDGVRRWGVNDLDELTRGGYRLDLLRLATSAVLAPDVALPGPRICRILLEHWRSAAPGPATDLDAAGHLRALVPVPKSAHAYYAALRSGPAATVPDPVRAAVEATAGPDWQPRWHARRAGTGSLGHPRVAAVGRDGDGRWHAREAKLLGPPTVAWPPANVGPIPDDTLYPAVTTALRGPHPGGRIDGWQLRRLAPDVVRIELAGLPAHDAERVLRSMAQALVDVHGTEPDALAAARADRTDDWLPDAAGQMAADTRDCHRGWLAAT